MTASKTDLKHSLEIRTEFLDKGRFKEAVERLEAALPTREGEVAYLLGCALAYMGRRVDAVCAFRLAHEFGDQLTACLSTETDPFIKQVAFESWSMNDDRHARILGPCPILGRREPQLSGTQEELVQQIVATHLKAQERGQVRLPPLSTVFKDVVAAHGGVSLTGPRVLFIGTRYINASTNYHENDFHYHYSNSAKQLGIDITVFDADDIIVYRPEFQRPAERVRAKLAELRQLILDNEFDLILFEGNFEPTERTIQPTFWAELKRLRPFFLTCFTSDSYRDPNVVQIWGDVADLMIVGDTNNSNYSLSSLKHKLLYSPIMMPFHESTSTEISGERDIDIGYIGSHSRNRDVYLGAAHDSGLRGLYVLHAGQSDQTGMTAYERTVRRFRMTFNNGYFHPSKSIITGRVFESILGRTLLFQEEGAALENFLSPYAHYIPVNNAHQFVILAQFFSKHDDLRARIVETAYQFYQEHYSAKVFWQALLGRAKRRGG